MVSIAPAAAAFSFGTAAIIAELEASSALATLKPSSVISPQASHCWVLKSVNARPRKLKALSSIPPVATSRSPSRDTSRPAIGPLKPLATITGSINIPASNGVFWCTNCSSWAISSSKPTRVIRAVIAIITPLKIMRWVNRRISTIGRAADSCLRINQVNIAAPPSATSAVSHSASWPFSADFALNTSIRIAAIKTSACSRLSGCSRRAGWRGTTFALIAITTSTIGTLIRNTDPQ
ncbi:Uncharacterised protein [Klebsiella pneumoniae]|nr:Uncharacterised protein [Klebsiella pneumoniae]